MASRWRWCIATAAFALPIVTCAALYGYARWCGNRQLYASCTSPDGSWTVEILRCQTCLDVPLYVRTTLRDGTVLLDEVFDHMDMWNDVEMSYPELRCDDTRAVLMPDEGTWRGSYLVVNKSSSTASPCYYWSNPEKQNETPECLTAWAEMACSRTDAETAEKAITRIDDPKALFGFYLRFAHCDGGAIAEGISEFITTLLYSHSYDIAELAKYAQRDPAFGDFVARHVHDTAGDDRVAHIRGNALDQCPEAAKELCANILGGCDYETVFKAATEVDTPEELYEYFLRGCSTDAVFGEAASEMVGIVLDDKWSEVQKLLDYDQQEPRFTAWIVDQIDVSMSSDQLMRIRENASSRCPAQAKDLCRKILERPVE